MIKYSKKLRVALLDTIFGRGKLVPPKLKLGIYDNTGKRRYWMPMPSVAVSDSKVTVDDLPELAVDEAFTFGWMQIDEEDGTMLVKLDVALTTKHLNRGETLKITGLTMTID